ncbi:hypothetical protein SBV1_3310009 [Verrucomicrobia bacterium]|nr:hypothetical protein SBV1_3310009 [Verrucomicrobiota bacterium]
MIHLDRRAGFYPDMVGCTRMYLDQAVGQPVRSEALVEVRYALLKDTHPPSWGCTPVTP